MILLVFLLIKVGVRANLIASAKQPRPRRPHHDRSPRQSPQRGPSDGDRSEALPPRLQVVNIAAICTGVGPSSCLPRRARPTSNTPTPADTTNPRISNCHTNRGVGVGTNASSSLCAGMILPGSDTATGIAATSANPPVASSDTVNTPSTPPVLPGRRCNTTPSVGPNRKPEMPAIDTNDNLRPSVFLPDDISVTAARRPA